MAINGLMRSTIMCVSTLAVLTATACSSTGSFRLASNGVGPGATEGTDGVGQVEVETPPVVSPPPPPSPPPPSPPPPGGLTQTANYLGGTLDNILISSGNTVKSVGDLVSNAGGTTGAPTGVAAGIVSAIGTTVVNLGTQSAQQGGIRALPVAGPVLETLAPALDQITAPAAKITILERTAVGSGLDYSSQLVGASLGADDAAMPAWGTLASANILSGKASNPGAVVSGNILEGELASAAILPNGLSIGSSGSIASLTNIAVGGTTVLAGTPTSAVNLNVLPDGLGGLTNATNLDSVLAPVRGVLAPITMGSTAPSTGGLTSVTGLVPGVTNTLSTVLNTNLTGGIMGSTNLLGGVTGGASGSTSLGGLLGIQPTQPQARSHN